MAIRNRSHGTPASRWLVLLTLTALALCASSVPRASAQALPGGTLDPTSVPKYVTPLVKPPVMPKDGMIRVKGGKNVDYYEIAVREFQQQILPAADAFGIPTGIPPTTVWSYGPAADPRTVAQGGRYFYPAFSIEAKFSKPVRVKWINDLVDPVTGDPLSHIVPVDPTLHWANPIGMRDMSSPDDPSDLYWTNPLLGPDLRYTGPVPMITHVHGAHTYQESDGYPEAWYLPAGSASVPGVEWTTGTYYDIFAPNGVEPWGDGFAVFEYPNDQRATTLWYHDHTLGMTRVNVYAGPAGFYLIRGGPDDMVLDSRKKKPTPAVLPGPAPGPGINPFGVFYEIPIAIQDRSFNADGSLFYPDHRAFFEGLNPFPTVPYLDIPFNPGLTVWSELSDVSPIWQPEFFGNVMVVNGQSWPFLDVEPRRYRFRLLNGCNSRFLILQFSDPRVQVWQIGAEGGFLPAPVDIDAINGGMLLMGPAERADVIVDFTNVPVGTAVTLLNLGPDEPFGGGLPGIDFPPADPGTTGQVMECRVVPLLSKDDTTPPQFLQMPLITPLVPTATRYLSLNEEESQTVFVEEDADGNVVESSTSSVPFGPTAALLGTFDPVAGLPTPLKWMDAVTENPAVGDTETWEIYNFTMDAHPVHIHLIQFQVVDRQVLAFGAGGEVTGFAGPPLPPEAWETGFKDTVIAYPGEVTRVKARFDIAGLFVWHCHIVEHEDNEMMRPYQVGP